MIPTIEPYKIIVLINLAWQRSFGRPVSNRKAIAERGWGPLNRCLLLDKAIRGTMTDEECAEEGNRGIITPTVTSTALVPYLVSASDASQVPALISAANLPAASATNASAISSFTPPRFDDQYLHPPESPPAEQMNLSQGQGAFCLDAIVRHKDLMEARERIKKERKEGKSAADMIEEQKGAVTSGKAFGAGIFRIGETILQAVVRSATNTKRIAKEKGDEARLLMQ